MKKLGLLVLLALLTLGTLSAVRADNDATGTPKIKKNNKITAQADLDCVKNALATREAAVIAAYTKYYTTINQALTKRQADLTAAWGKPVIKERRAAIKLAWSDFYKAKKAANKEYNATVKNAWKAFRAAAKTCKVNSAYDEPSGWNMGERGDSAL